MHKSFVLLVIALALSGSVKALDTAFQFADTCRVVLEAVNLSEDMSTLSSKNDELLVLLYDYTDTTKISTPMLNEFFVLDSTVRTKTMTFVTPRGATSLLLFLIELDTDRTKQQVERIIRTHYAEIMALFTAKDLIALQKIIGDDDLMGFNILNVDAGKPNASFSIQGRYKLDKYLYRIRVE